MLSFVTYINYINLQQSKIYFQERVVFGKRNNACLSYKKWEILFVPSVGSISLILTLKQPTNMINLTYT